MRFISIFTHEPTNRPPTEAEMAAMGKLIEDAMKAGWLIATEGVHFGGTGVRVHKSAHGKSRSPTARSPRPKGLSAAMRCSKRLQGGRLSNTRRFLSVVGQGSCEIHELYATRRWLRSW
jgi:hypothetical protein